MMAGDSNIPPSAAGGGPKKAAADAAQPAEGAAPNAPQKDASELAAEKQALREKLGRSLASPEVLLAELDVAPDDTCLTEMLAATGLAKGSPELAQVREGLLAYLPTLLAAGDAFHVDLPSVDLLIAEVLEKLSRQLDAILHHPAFQALEAGWRALRFVVDRVEFRENIQIALLNVSKQDLREDFEDSPEVARSGLFKVVYSAEFGQFGGRPYALLVGNYEFSPHPQDVALLDDCAAVATMAHAPFVAGAGPDFFGLESFLDLPQLDELAALFNGARYTKWRAFRDVEDSRYVGLCLPRFLLRVPYSPQDGSARSFHYRESMAGGHGDYLWGNAAFAFATCVASSFASSRWCLNIVGPDSGGTVNGLVLHHYEALGRLQAKIPTEVMVTESREGEISAEGFMPLVFRAETESACFFSAHSAQRPKRFANTEDGRSAELNHRLGTELPYLFICSRISHYLKVIQRENVGSWKERADIERQLQAWLSKLVIDQDGVSASLRAQRPLRKAHVTVSEVAGNAGWFKIDLRLRPHFTWRGAVFDLNSVGRLEPL